MPDQVLEIPLDQIIPHPGNRRVGGFDPKKLQELAESIRLSGVLQPAVVRESAGNAGKYELLAGERRLRASRLAGKETLPCVVKALTDEEALVVVTVTNLQREDVHPLDEADGYTQLIDVAKLSIEAVAEKVGKSASYVYQRLKLRELIPNARKLLEDGSISAGHAILIARLRPEDQKAAAKWCGPGDRSDAASVRELTQWIYQNVYLSLARAPFRKDDLQLVPKAGSCIACPKRTAFQPLLFADVGKDDQCLDRTCYHAKLDALVKRRQKELEAEGVKVVRVHSKAENYYERERDPKASDAYDFVSAKKGDPGAVALLVTTGTERGQMSYGKPRPRERIVGYQPSPAEKKREEERKAKDKEARRQRSSLATQVLDHVERHHKRTGRLPDDVLRIMAMDTLEGAYGDQLQRIEEALGIESSPAGGRTMDSQDRRHEVVSKAVAELRPAEIPVYLARVIILEDAASVWHGHRTDYLSELAKARGIKPAPQPSQPKTAERKASAKSKKPAKRNAA